MSRVYSDVLAHKPRNFYEYDNFSPVSDDIDDYSLIRKIGSGKYSIGKHVATLNMLEFEVLKVGSWISRKENEFHFWIPHRTPSNYS